MVQEFTEHILPMLYSHTNFSSFERQMNFYSFKKMAVSAELPSKKRMKRTDPAKFKHRLFHQNASLEQINKICRSTSCHQTRQVKETRLIMRSRNSKMNNNISELEGEVTSLPVLSPPVQVQVARARALTTELPAEGTANRRHRVIMATQCCPRFCSIAAGELGNESLDNLDTFTFDVDGAVSLLLPVKAVWPCILSTRKNMVLMKLKQAIDQLKNPFNQFQKELDAHSNVHSSGHGSNEDDDEISTNDLSV